MDHCPLSPHTWWGDSSHDGLAPWLWTPRPIVPPPLASHGFVVFGTLPNATVPVSVCFPVLAFPHLHRHARSNSHPQSLR